MADVTNTERVVLITGAANGIGAALATAAVRRGYSVALGDRDGDTVEAHAEALRAVGPAWGARVDVTDKASITTWVTSAEAHFGGVDVLVNSAGGFPAPRQAEDLEFDEWQQVLAVNLTGTFLCCQATLPAMRRRGGGRIVNVASEAGRMPTWVTGAHYVAAKAGVLGLTRHLALEVGRDNITVNAVAPGTTLTERVSQLYNDKAVERLISRTPVGHLATVEDQVGPILFLISDEAKYMTGTTLDVNGGRVMM